jgi:transposase
MVGHIYGRVQLLTVLDRPNLFVNELRLNVEYLRNEIRKRLDSWTAKEEKHFGRFRANLQEGIAYYKSLIPKLVEETERYRETMRTQILELEQELLEIVVPSTEVCAEV